MFTRRIATLMGNVGENRQSGGGKSVLALLIFSLCIVSMAGASNINITEMSLEDLLNLKVTVASKTEQTIDDAPSSVTVISREEMLNMGVNSVEELLNYIPGFVVARDVTSFRKDYVHVRGGRYYDVLFLYNGQRINSLFQGAYSDVNQFIPVENIKQIEVIRGPGSALYGSNAFLGVVNIITVDDVNDVYVAAGDMERKEASVNVSKEMGDLNIAGFVKGFSDLGYKYGEVTDKSGTTEMTRDPTKGFNASLTLKYKNFSLDARHNEVEIEDFVMWGYLGNGINDSKNAQSHITLKYLVEATDDLEFDVSAGYVYDRLDTVIVQVPAGRIPVGFDENGVPTALNSQILAGGPYLTEYTSNLNVDARWKILENNNLIAGISVEYSEILEATNQAFWNNKIGNEFEYIGMLDHNAVDGSFNKEENRRVIGLYFQDQHQFTGALDFLSLTAGVRYDDYSDFGDTLNPRGALIVTTPFQSKFKLMYGQAFRAPNFSELYNANNPNYIGNDKLDAEKVETWEVAYVQNFSFIRGSLTYYNSKVTDKILTERRIDPNNPRSQLIYENLGDERTKGIEFDLKLAPVSGLLIAATYMSFIDPNKDSLLVPANTGSISVNWSPKFFPVPVNLNVNGLYREKMKIMDKQDDYFIFNTAVYVNLTDNLRLKGVIHNLADEEYYTYTPVMPIINRGRTFTIGIECPL